ncbi:NAD-dependent epimerase/dehydratase [Nitzschia inconspicua]|uniref:NAD-dependent epimerase/dehydratase n=1 Tax=Nitzschia inconspicua TaxID=303405 RepID=A0A9K3KLB8_9STRA|nr:NAD-dependent epimerase/dehydratase [Nitzschia inconspicua]
MDLRELDEPRVDGLVVSQRLKRTGNTFPSTIAWLILLVFSMSTTTTTRRRHMVAAALSPKVAVLGGTGRLGRATVLELLKNDIPVSCLVRPSSSVPSDWPSDKVTVVRGELMDGAGKPSAAVVDVLNGCTHCVAVYGATRKTKISDFWDQSVEDTDPTHAKQLNYESMKALVEACKQTNCSQILRITGKGEDPTSFFSVLINGLGSFAKGWNYEGEQVLREQNDVDYTIIRPGIMKEDYPPPPKDDGKPVELEYLELAENGGDLPVSAVSYQQIAQLLVDCILNQQSKRVTVTAMNVKGKPALPTVKERVQALHPDSRKFPKSLIDEHKMAVYKAATRVTAVVTVLLVGLIKLIFF